MTPDRITKWHKVGVSFHRRLTDCGLPDGVVEELVQYVVHGTHPATPGLRFLLENVVYAAGRALPDLPQWLGAWLDACRDVLPINSWGTPQRVWSWMQLEGLAGADALYLSRRFQPGSGAISEQASPPGPAFVEHTLQTILHDSRNAEILEGPAA